MLRNIFKRKVTLDQILELYKKQLNSHSLTNRDLIKRDKEVLRYLNQIDKTPEEKTDYLIFDLAVSRYIKGEINKNPLVQVREYSSMKHYLYGEPSV